MHLSVIIPVGPGETGWGALPHALEALPDEVELLFVGCPRSASLQKDARIQHLLRRHPGGWLETEPGRARQQNLGARRARGEYLWFLHADSTFDPRAWEVLSQALGQKPGALLYFRLGFLGDGPALMGLNQWGANLRSRAGLPFGDQGFCLRRQDFLALGGFDEAAAYGEDALLVWQAHRHRLALRGLPAILWTSARNYRRHGWLRLTLRYQWLWMRQAFSLLTR